MADKRQGLTRRGFLRTAAAAGAAPLVAGAVGAAGLAPGEARAASGMPVRTFGRSGVKVPILSMGGMYDIPNNQIILKQAIALGVTYWDTANSYEGGNSEEGIGIFFAARPEERQKIFLVTKSTHRDPRGWTEHLELSLRRMKTNYVDLFFIHSVTGIDEVTQAARLWGEEMKKEGKIKLMGFSTHRNMAECLLGGAKLGWIDGIMMTYNWRLVSDKAMNQAIDACTKEGIGLTAMKTMGAGPFSFIGGDESITQRFVSKGFTPEQAKLKAVWQDPRIAAICSQMPSLEILRINAAAAMDKVSLSMNDRRHLEAYARATDCYYCAGCAGICEGLVEGRPPVGDLMRALMYHHGYQEPAQAAATAQGMGQGVVAAMAGLDYARAESACPQGLPISRLVDEAARLWA